MSGDHNMNQPGWRKRQIALDIKAENAPEQEPAAWMVYTQDGQSVYVTDNPTDIQEGQRALPLYTHPPQRTWAGLTDSEWSDLYEAHYDKYNIPKQGTPDGMDYERAIEAKLKEKNGF